MVECSFKYSGSVERVAWLAPGGKPEKGKIYQFTTQYDKPGIITGDYVMDLQYLIENKSRSNHKYDQ